MLPWLSPPLRQCSGEGDLRGKLRAANLGLLCGSAAGLPAVPVPGEVRPKSPVWPCPAPSLLCASSPAAGNAVVLPPKGWAGFIPRKHSGICTRTLCPAALCAALPRPPLQEPLLNRTIQRRREGAAGSSSWHAPHPRAARQTCCLLQKVAIRDSAGLVMGHRPGQPRLPALSALLWQGLGAGKANMPGSSSQEPCLTSPAPASWRWGFPPARRRGGHVGGCLCVASGAQSPWR